MGTDDFARVWAASAPTVEERRDLCRACEFPRKALRGCFSRSPA